MQKKVDVVGLGCCAVDFLAIVPQYPKPDTKTQVLEFTKQGGGLVGTALVALARLGARTRFVGKVGDDELGRFIVDTFKQDRVDTSGLKLVKGCTARFAFIVVDKATGKRTIFWTQAGIPKMTASDVRRADIASARFLHVDGLEMDAQLAAARMAKECGTTVVMDAEGVWPGTKELLALCDVIIASEAFIRAYTGERNATSGASALYGEHQKIDPRKIVVVTAGVRGSVCVSADGSFLQPAFDVDVVDTTGCGDVYHGAFIFGLLRKWDLRRTAQFASAVAALKCRELGGRAGIPTLPEVQRFLGSR